MTEPQPRVRPEITRSPVTAFVIGLVAAVVSAVFGISGALVIAPGMASMLRTPPGRANGTALAVMIPIALIAAFQYHVGLLTQHHGGLNLGTVAWLAVTGVLGAWAGALLLRFLKPAPARLAVSVVVIAAGVWLALRPAAASLRLPPGLPSVIIVGALAGVLGGMLRAGGGLALVPGLVLLLGQEQHLAQGTSLAVLALMSLLGALPNAARGNVVWSLAQPMALGAIIGAGTAASLVFTLPDPTLRALFGTLLIAAGVRMALVKPKQEKDAPRPELAPADERRSERGA